MGCVTQVVQDTSSPLTIPPGSWGALQPEVISILGSHLLLSVKIAA